MPGLEGDMVALSIYELPELVGVLAPPGAFDHAAIAEDLHASAATQGDPDGLGTEAVLHDGRAPVLGIQHDHILATDLLANRTTFES